MRFHAADVASLMPLLPPYYFHALMLLTTPMPRRYVAYITADDAVASYADGFDAPPLPYAGYYAMPPMILFTAYYAAPRLLV